MQTGDEEDHTAMRCNGCWTACDAKEHTIVTKCGHLYCLNCCQTILESDDPTCPICNQLLQKSNIKAVHAQSTGAELALSLAGQTPRVTLEVAHAAIQFYNKQQQLYSQYAQAQSQRKVAKTQEQCRKKLQEVHNGYLNAKRKYQEVLAQKAALEEGNKELMEKYNQKAMQDKKLKESFALLQQENEKLRRHAGVLPGGSSGAGGLAVGSGLPGMTALGGGGGGGSLGSAGRNSRGPYAGMGLDDPLSGRPVLAARQVPPEPSPVPSIGLGSFGRSLGFDTPENLSGQPAPLRVLRGGGPAGMGGMRVSGGLVAGGGGMTQQAMHNNKRQSLGLAFPGPNSMGTM